MVVVEGSLEGPGGLEVLVDIVDACFVECCVGFSEAEGVTWKEGLVWEAGGEVEGCGKGGGGAVDFREGFCG